MTDVQKAIRLSNSLLGRVNRVVRRMETKDEYTAMGRVTEVGVLRLAILRGIVGLEKELDKKYGKEPAFGMKDHFVRAAQAPEGQTDPQEKSDE